MGIYCWLGLGDYFWGMWRNGVLFFFEGFCVFEELIGGDY